MNKEQLWKNFSLGTELDVSGSFLYNAVYGFDKLWTFERVEEVFEILYNFAVGIERLQKIVIILTEYDTTGLAPEAFEESIKIHNHAMLLQRIRKNHTIRFTKPENNFITLLSRFYQIMRYDRFTFKTEGDYNKEQEAFVDYLSKLNGVEISNLRNSKEAKVALGRVVKKITSEFYGIVSSECRRLNLYTSEIRYDSKASEVFLTDKSSINFIEDNIYKKELLYYLVSLKEKINFPTVPPLDLDHALIDDHIGALLNEETFRNVCDEVAHHLDEAEGKEERMAFMDDLELIVLHSDGDQEGAEE